MTATRFSLAYAGVSARLILSNRLGITPLFSDGSLTSTNQSRGLSAESVILGRIILRQITLGELAGQEETRHTGLVSRALRTACDLRDTTGLISGESSELTPRVLFLRESTENSVR